MKSRNRVRIMGRIGAHVMLNVKDSPKVIHKG